MDLVFFYFYSNRPTDRDLEHQQVPGQPWQRHHGRWPEEHPRPLQELPPHEEEAHPPPAELSRGQQQNALFRQPQPQGGVLQRVTQLILTLK